MTIGNIRPRDEVSFFFAFFFGNYTDISALPDYSAYRNWFFYTRKMQTATDGI